MLGGMIVRAAAGPVVGRAAVRFRFDDPRGALQEVRLHQELQRPRAGPAFARDRAGTWTLDFPRPAVDRMEYQLQLGYPGARPLLVPDPGNPLRADGPFGQKSVIQFPGYRPPAWLAAGTGEEPTTALAVASRLLRARVPVRLWSSPGARPGEPLPLLVAHDGPEYARYAGLLAFLAHATGGGRLPPMRAALLQPVDRAEHYSAAPAWSRALLREVLPALEAPAPTPPGRRWRVGMGASLGAVATLAAQRAGGDAFGALFLQSGSFFQRRLDAQEAGVARFTRICRFVAQVLAGPGNGEPVTVAMTCGAVEENLANNRAVRDALAAQGAQVRLHERPDAHNWVAWRDALDPWLLRLLQQAWG
jgi:enterochelin esterase-like enzyme